MFPCSVELCCQRFRAFDVDRLSALAPTAQQHDQDLALLSEIDPSARPQVDAQFTHALPDRANVASQTSGKALDASRDRTADRTILHGSHPVSKLRKGLDRPHPRIVIVRLHWSTAVVITFPTS